MISLKKLRGASLSAIYKLYPRFGLRNSDIILASFPKSGNTWMRFIWANMVSLIELGGRNIDFRILDTKLVAEYDSGSYGDLEFNCLPRIVKTHKKYNKGAFSKNRSIYVIRHPGDVSVSYFEYKKSEIKKEHITSLSEFIRDSKFGVDKWCNHVQEWISKADVVIRYEDLKRNPVLTIQRVLQELGLCHIDEYIVVQAIERSSFDRMKNAEREKGRVREDDFDTGYQFMRKGKMGEWKKRLDRDDVKYIRTLLRKSDLISIYNL